MKDHPDLQTSLQRHPELNGYQAGLFTISSFVNIPLTHYFISYFFQSTGRPVQLSQCYVHGYTRYDQKVVEKNLAEFQTFSAFMSQNIWQKSSKYLQLIWYMGTFTLSRRRSILYVQDVFSLLLALMLRFLLFWKKQVVVYHQFEVLEPRRMSLVDRWMLKLAAGLQKGISMVLIPEKNRMDYFVAQTGLKRLEDTLVFPNTNSGQRSVNIPRGKKSPYIIAHVGNVGLDHYISAFMEALQELQGEGVEVWFLGRVSPEVIRKIESYQNPVVRILGEVPHYALGQYYEQIDLGVILYRDLDVNYRFCAPNKLYEYWSYGIPVIGHALPGLIPVFTKSFQGAITNMDETAMLAGEMKKWINDPATSDKRRELKDYFDQNLTIDAFLKDFSTRFETKLK